MADRFLVPDDLKSRYGPFELAAMDVENINRAWDGLEADLEDAAGDDEETSQTIKEQAKNVNPTVKDLVVNLTRFFSETGEKGRATADGIDRTEDESVQRARDSF